LIYVIGMIFSFPLYSFFYGLFGGWDTNTLHDFQRAVNLSSFTKPAAWTFWKASQLGASISPLHNRFPIDIYEPAMEEARSLTKERVNLLKASQTSLATGE
jgi:hypothetical protein